MKKMNLFAIIFLTSAFAFSASTEDIKKGVKDTARATGEFAKETVHEVKEGTQEGAAKLKSSSKKAWGHVKQGAKDAFKNIKDSAQKAKDEF